MFEALRTMIFFLLKNWTIRDPRSPSRHPWRWCLFVAVDILISRITILRPKSGVAVILVNRLGDAIVGRPLVMEIQSILKKDDEPFLVLGDKSWEVLGDNIYKDIPTKFIDEKRFCSNLIYRVKISYWLRTQNYRTVICFMHHRLEMRDDALVYISSGEERIVSELPFLQLRWYPWLFDFYLNNMTRIIPALKPINDSLPQVDVFCKYQRKVPHAVQRFQDFCRHIDPDVDIDIQPLELSSEYKLFSENIVVLNPGAKHKARIWPLIEWIELACQISERGYIVCFIGGPAEERLIPEYYDLIKRKITNLGESLQFVEAINKISFNFVIGLFRRAVCYIGPDTGTSHLAFWLGTPTITLLLHNDGTEEGDRFGDFFPYPENFLPTPYRCICTTKDKFHMRDGSISIRSKVWAAFNDLIKNYETGK